jgi:hypothetical protein
MDSTNSNIDSAGGSEPPDSDLTAQREPMRERIRIITSAMALVTLTSTIYLAVPGESHAFLGLAISIGALLGLGKLTKSSVDDSVDNAVSGSKQVMEEASTRIDGLLAQVEASYGHSLDTTLSSLDTATGQQLAEMARLFDEINQKLMADGGMLTQAGLDLIEKAGLTAQQTVAQLEDLTLVVVGGATFVIDKTTFNVAFLIAAVLLAVGLLTFARLLWTRQVPQQGWVRGLALACMALYVLLFGSILTPQARGWAITMIGQAHQLESVGSGPQIFSVTPKSVVGGESVDIVLIGAHLDGDGESQVTVSGKKVRPAASSDTHVHIHLTGALAKLKGPQGIEVMTTDGERASTTVEFLVPPTPPKLLSWRLLPSGKAWHIQQFPSKPVRCTLDKTQYSRGRCDFTVLVDAHWELAMEKDAEFDKKIIYGGVPNPARGFVERQVARATSPSCIITRRIEIYPIGGVATKTGIHVLGEVANIPGLPTGACKYLADYSVWGKRLLDKDGDERVGKNCTVTGLVKCDTYPAGPIQKAKFQDGRPERIDLRIQVQTAGTAQPENYSKTFTPGTTGEKLVLGGGLEVWIEEQDGAFRLMAMAPGAIKSTSHPMIFQNYNKLMIGPEQGAQKAAFKLKAN